MSGTSTLNLDILWVSLVFRKFQECGNLIHKTSDIKVLGIISIPMAILYSNIPWQEVLYSDSHSSGNVGSMQRWNWEMTDETCWVETNLNGNMRYMIWNSQFCWLRPSGCWEYSKAESAMLRRQTEEELRAEDFLECYLMNKYCSWSQSEFYDVYVHLEPRSFYFSLNKHLSVISFVLKWMLLKFFNKARQLVAHTFNLSISDAEIWHISVRSRLDWSTKQVPAQPGLHTVALYQNKMKTKTRNKTKSKYLINNSVWSPQNL